MAKTKRRVQEVVEEVFIGTKEQQKEATVPADDQTALDDLEKKKGKKEKLPDGFKKRLKEGTAREISINKDEIGKEGGKICIVRDETGKILTVTADVRIEGECEIVHKPGDVGCGVQGRVVLRTKASILIGKSKKE